MEKEWMKMKKLWIFDIDGTLANNEKRVKFLKGATKDWRAFFADQTNDSPYEAVVEILRTLVSSGDRCIIITGRDEEHRQESLKWLDAHYGYKLFPSSDLIMRPRGEREDDDTLKLKLLDEWMKNNPGYRVMGVFEDRHRVIDAWRNAGIYCFECNQYREDF
jgi:trehalose-6-phosphatase